MNTTPTIQDEHQAATVGCSQKERLLARLLQAHGEEVPMPELACAMSEGGHGTGVPPTRRISELRKDGYNIPAPRREGSNTWYRLIPKP